MFAEEGKAGVKWKGNEISIKRKGMK